MITDNFNAGNSQTWNRYAYVGNNPLSNVDPLGLDDRGWGGLFPDCFFNVTNCALSGGEAYACCVFIGLCGYGSNSGGSDSGLGANSILRKTTVVNSATPGASNSSLCTTYNICNAPASVQVTDGNGASKSYSTFAYDAAGTTHGSVTSISSSTSGASSGPFLTQQYSYNSVGTLATATEPNGTQTTHSYSGNSCNGAFPTSVTVAGLTTQYGYICSGGVVMSVTDPNNAITSTTYNEAGCPR